MGGRPPKPTHRGGSGKRGRFFYPGATDLSVSRSGYFTCVMRTCGNCRVEKEESEFYATGKKEGALTRTCKKCISAKSKALPKSHRTRMRNLEYHRLNKDRYSALQLKRLYGISVETRDRMEAAQGGVCAICLSRPNTKLCVDHDHTTGKVRALLCRRCNAAIGILEDSVLLVQAAADYLKKFI